MDRKRRIKYIDLCKGLGILMVTWGHITKLDNPVDTWAGIIQDGNFLCCRRISDPVCRFLSDTDIKGVCSKVIEVIDAAICLI